MADLDDFFAKKDKKKNKTKKFTSSDELVKKLETGISKEKEPVKIKKDEENEEVSVLLLLFQNVYHFYEK